VEELKQQRIILTSYALLRQDAFLLQSLSYECVVLDEAQCIKNDKSQTAQSSFLLRSKLRLAITGTPIENKWEELWSLFYFLDPELLGKRKDFVAAQGDERQWAEMKKCIRPFILRRRKDQIAHQLPPKYEQLIWVDMQQAQRTLYEEWRAKHRGDLLKKIEREGAATHRVEILEAILRLRQICCHPHLVVPTLEGDLLELSAKLERLITDLDSVVQEGHKVLVYSQFTQMLRLIEKQVQQRGWSYVYLDGSSQDRESLVQRFQEDPQTPLFLMSLKAGGVGLNLTAADYVFLFDPWWNEAVEAQAIDRAHRFGRKTEVIARRYITASSIEEKMMNLKQHKSSLSRQLFDFDSSGPLTLDDLYDLLS
jgi:SNF2 family DNA or RNA helicase